MRICGLGPLALAWLLCGRGRDRGSRTDTNGLWTNHRMECTDTRAEVFIRIIIQSNRREREVGPSEAVRT